MKKIKSSPNFCTVLKKSHQCIFSLQYEKKINKRRKKIKQEKNKIGNILKEKY
jgi:hypothetical protein